MRDKGRIRSLPACLKPGKAECEDYTVGDSHTITVCEGLVKRKCKFFLIIAEILHLQAAYHFGSLFLCMCLQSLNVMSMDHAMTLPTIHALPLEKKHKV